MSRRAMTADEFATLVEWIDNRFGRVGAWANAHEFVGDYEGVDSEDVWEALLSYTDNPEHRWPPEPRQLRALAMERTRARIRHESRPALPENVTNENWAAWCEKTYGERISFAEAIERRHEELAKSGRAVVDGE